MAFIFCDRNYDDVGLMVRNEKLLFFVPTQQICQVLCKGAPLYKRSGFISFDIVEDSWKLL